VVIFFGRIRTGHIFGNLSETGRLVYCMTQSRGGILLPPTFFCAWEGAQPLPYGARGGVPYLLPPA